MTTPYNLITCIREDLSRIHRCLEKLEKVIEKRDREILKLQEKDEGDEQQSP